jgi:hypothetical protein
MDDEPDFRDTEQGLAEAEAMAEAHRKSALLANEMAEARLPPAPDPMSIPFWTIPMVVGWVMSRDAGFVGSLARRGDADFATVAQSAVWDRMHLVLSFIVDQPEALRQVQHELIEGRLHATALVGEARRTVTEAEWQDVVLRNGSSGVVIVHEPSLTTWTHPSVKRDAVISHWPTPPDKAALPAKSADSNGVSHHQSSPEHAPDPPVLRSPGRRGQMSRNLTAALREEFGDELGRSSRDMSRAQNAVAAWHRQNADARLPEDRNWRRNIDRIWSS